MRWAMLLLLLAGQAQAGGWAFDAEQSELVLKVWKAGAASSLAHDHVIRATKFAGEASLDDAGTPESLKLNVVVQAAHLVPDEPDVRRRYHLPNTPLSDDQRETVTKNMLGAGQLDVAQHPTITFSLERLTPAGEDRFTCEGTLTLHGVSRRLVMPVKVSREPGTLAGTGQVRFKTSEFGIAPYSAALGLVKNKDEVELHARVVVRRAD